MKSTNTLLKPATKVHRTPIFGVQVLHYSDGTSMVKQYNNNMEGFSIPVDHHIDFPGAMALVLTTMRLSEHAPFYQKYYGAEP